jgi:hypothetical protein
MPFFSLETAVPYLYIMTTCLVQQPDVTLLAGAQPGHCAAVYWPGGQPGGPRRPSPGTEIDNDNDKTLKYFIFHPVL